MTPEGKVKQWFMDQVERYYKGFDVWKYAPPGGQFGQAGIGDRLLVIEGVPVMIEIKSGEGSYGLTPLQKKRLREFAEAGGVGASLIGKDVTKCMAIFAEIDRRRMLWHRAMQLEKSDG